MVKYYLTFLVFTCLILSSYSNAQCDFVEVNLLGNGNLITDGDLTPNLTDHSDFGSVTACNGNIVRTFTIENTGTNSLNLAHPTLSGADAAEFSITLNPSVTVLASGSTTFQVTFDPSTSGTKSATITFTNDDCDEATYDFAIEGRGISLPTTSCLPSTTNSGDFGTGIVNFVFHTINNTHSDFMNDGTQDFTCSNYTTVLPGSTYTFTANLYGTLGFGANDEFCQVYIDYNDDGSFSEGEIVYSQMDTRQMIHSGNITIPTSGAVTGKLLRMRVKTDYGTFSDGCADSGYGEIEDYAIYIDCFTPTITGYTPSAICGTGTVDLEATASAGTLKWYDALTGGTLLGIGTTFTTPSISSTTTYYAEVVERSCMSAARTAVVATIVTNCTQVLASQCGTTLAGLRTAISADKVTGATRYRFELKEGVNTHVVTTVNRWIFVDQFNYKNATSYSIRVAREIGGVFGPYGDPCSVTTAHPSTKVLDTQCGNTLATVSTAISADQVKGATAYKFRITDGTNTYYVERANRWFYLSDFNYKLNQTYTIDVASNLGTGFSAYGSPCTITTPIPSTKVLDTQCGTTLATNSTAISADQVKGASFYKFKITNGATVQYVILTVRWMYLYHITYTPGTSYSIEVQAKVNGAWGPYGAACTITTPGSGMIQNPNDEVLSKFENIELNAYPNPSNGDFTISSSHEGTFNIINELGQLVQTVEITKENNFQVKVDSMLGLNPLQLGVYFITGTVNNEIITTKVVIQ